MAYRATAGPTSVFYIVLLCTFVYRELKSKGWVVYFIIAGVSTDDQIVFLSCKYIFLPLALVLPWFFIVGQTLT